MPGWIVPLDQAYREAIDRIERVANLLAAPIPNAPPPPQCDGPLGSNMDRKRYESMVRRGKEYIRAGDILQVVLAQRLSVAMPGDPFGLYRRLRTVSAAPYMYYLDFGDHQIVGASPELLVLVEDGMVTPAPSRARCARGDTPEEEALATRLLSDEKERAEHSCWSISAATTLAGSAVRAASRCAADGDRALLARHAHRV